MSYNDSSPDDDCTASASTCIKQVRHEGTMVRGEFFPNTEDTWCVRKKLRARQNTTFARLAHEHQASRRQLKVEKRRVRSLEERAFTTFEEVRLELQASGDYLHTAQTFIRTADAYMDTDFIKLMEDLIVFMMLLSRARAKADIMLALLVFVKLRSNKSLAAEALENLTYLTEGLFGAPEVQSLEEKVTSFREMMSKWDEMKDTLMGKKYIKLTRYLIAYGVFSHVGIRPSVHNLRRSEEMCGVLDHADFMFSIVDTLTFTLQRSLMFMRTGEWSVFLHGPKTYAAWFDKCLDVKRKAYSIGNLEAQGTDYFQFVSTIKECIEEGHAIVKFASRDLKAELRSAKLMLHEILMIEATVLTKKSAQQERRAPFALLVHGESAVAKSMFQKMLFYYYGKLMNLPTTEEYKFTRSPSDQYWSGFSSQAWCIQMDDIGFLNPTKASEDVSLAELIAVVNNVPLVPNQADLADKGKTPVRARFVIASSNAKDLNAHAYFYCPLAVQRRLPWVITVSPRPEFERLDAEGMINPAAMTAIDGDWPNFWRIHVDKVVPGGKVGARSMAQFEAVKTFEDTQSFLDWFGPVCKEFDIIQAKAMADDARMSELVLCQLCNRTTRRCTCEANIQAVAELPVGVEYGESFTETYDDGAIKEVKTYDYVRGAYMCTTDTFRDGELLRSRVTPMPVYAKVQADEDGMAYADVLNEVIQRQKAREPTLSGRFVAGAMSVFLQGYVRFAIVRTVADWMLTLGPVRSLVVWSIKNYVPPLKMARCFFEFVGTVVNRSMTTSRWRKIILGLGAASAAWLVYKRLNNWNVQGSTMSVPDEHFKKTERENVWKRDDYQTTSFDVDPMSLNWASLPKEQVVSMVRKNTARIFVTDNYKVIPGNAFCVGGHLWVTNNHILPDLDDAPLHIKFQVDPLGQGTSRNVDFVLEQSSIYRESGSDLAYFEILAVDARTDLTRLISKGTLDGDFQAKYIGLNRDSSAREVPVSYVQKVMARCETLDRTFTYWRGHVAEDTVNGDCGTPLVGMSPSVVILGLHQLGGSNKVAFAVKLTQSSLHRAQAHFARPIIQAGVPRISSKYVEKTVSALGHRSPLRWLESGSLTVFGSFVGYQVRSRSKVASTLCGDYIKAARAWDIPFGRPDLKDWRPWHLAYKDVTGQENILQASILKQAVDGYVSDVCAGLDEDAKATLRIISDHAAINGIAGVQYIDKMNFNSSMGEPFNKTKKNFTRPAPTELQPDAKVFNEEVMERAAHIEERYRAGIRACPVFSGQLKDEARSHAKIAAGKIRVFTGAPADWSFVVRKHLLSFVKVVQENRLLFEAAPGCVTQSLEWEQFRDYLVAHGENQIVAGDYGKFDKKMTAQVILSAFDVIAAILKFAGWSMEDLLVIYGIGEDTAYPFVNFQGDLVMLYGSNPSGHPLTVIVNSIVNALYLRYCYIVLSEKKECCSFKAHVNLLTYGDDNVMGVCRSIPWFNHTAIVGALKTIGVEYTMADKESVSVPYINIQDVSFLKRTWRYDGDVGAFVCPLEEQSIHKMLCVNIPSKTISAEAQMLFVMNSAVREWFYYGRERFEIERNFLNEVCVEFELCPPVPFPTWDQLKDAFWRASEGLSVVRLGEYHSHLDLIGPKPSVVVV